MLAKVQNLRIGDSQESESMITDQDCETIDEEDYSQDLLMAFETIIRCYTPSTSSDNYFFLEVKKRYEEICRSLKPPPSLLRQSSILEHLLKN